MGLLGLLGLLAVGQVVHTHRGEHAVYMSGGACRPVAGSVGAPKTVPEGSGGISVALDSTVDILSRVVSAEARGESFRGQVAVANVVLNRVASPLFPNTVREVVYQPGQFCPVRMGSIYDPPTESAIKAAETALAGVRVVGEDVLFFFNPKTAGCQWIRTREVATTIGRHRFVLAQRGR